MIQATDTGYVDQQYSADPPRALCPPADDPLKDVLKRCSPATRAAAREFRKTGSTDQLPAIIHGLIEHYVERDARAKLERGDDSLRLVEDLAIDSLTMLEIVFLAEEVLQVSIDNEELRPFRTVGDIKQFIVSKMGGATPGALAFPQAQPE
jgi:acyl carrier protein